MIQTELPSCHASALLQGPSQAPGAQGASWATRLSPPSEQPLESPQRAEEMCPSLMPLSCWIKPCLNLGPLGCLSQSSPLCFGSWGPCRLQYQEPWSLGPCWTLILPPGHGLLCSRPRPFSQEQEYDWPSLVMCLAWVVRVQGGLCWFLGEEGWRGRKPEEVTGKGRCWSHALNAPLPFLLSASLSSFHVPDNRCPCPLTHLRTLGPSCQAT